MTNKTIGIFVDAENVPNPSIVNPIVRTAKNSGSLRAVVLFGNWNSPALTKWSAPQIKKNLSELGAIWSPLPKLRPGKNAADIALTYEAALMTQGGNINQVWIVSSDSDFTPLVERLSQNQIHVVIFGSKNTPISLRTACSSFVLLNDIENGTRTTNTLSTLAPEKLKPDSRGWFHGFVKSLKGTFGFIQASPQEEVFFCENTVEAPLGIRDLRNGDPVEFKLGRNYRGWMAIHVRKVFALRTT